MAANRLYYTDAYTTKFETRLVDKTTVDGQLALILNETYFYPTSGGQPHDKGTLNDVLVVDVQVRDDGEVLHIVDGIPAANRMVGEIDWNRRFDHMRQHTGQHILSRAFIEVIDADTIGFHMSDNSLTIDLDCTELPLIDLDAAETLANQIIAENRQVRAWFPTPEELRDLPLRKISEKVTGPVRIVDVGGFDICACGGTHVERAGEIGMIKVVRMDKSRQNVRLEFRCGERALEDYREKNNLLLQLATEMTTGYRELPENLNKLREDNKTLNKELKAAKARLLAYEADDLWRKAQTAAPDAKSTIVAEIFENRETSDLQGLANALTARPNTIAFLGLIGEKGHLVFAASEDANYDVVPVFKAALETLGTNRGGGRPTLAQGGGFSVSREQLESIMTYARQRALSGE